MKKLVLFVCILAVCSLAKPVPANADTFPISWAEIQHFSDLMALIDAAPNKAAHNTFIIKNARVSRLRTMYPQLGGQSYLGPVVGFPRNVNWYQAAYWSSPTYQRIKAVR